MGKSSDKKASKKSKKEAKSEKVGDTAEGPSYDELVSRVNVISKPLAGKKLTKKLYKGVKKAANSKGLCRGVKEVGKALRKGSKGICIIAGDISPIDVISHVPVMCEEASIPYIFVPSKQDLGAAGQTKRPTSIVLIKSSDASDEEYSDLVKEVSAES
eukprot:m.1142371 g.1142371  ORF g.1142371 m.1142371 type:complete len:158 (+) comp24454_c0_seq3:134-607(+)